MPSIQSVERIVGIKYADSQAVKQWRDKARVMAMSALSLASHPDYIVYGVRNTRALIGIAAIQDKNDCVYLLHLASREAGRGIGTLLLAEIARQYNDKRIKTTPEPGAESFYESLGWRHVGKEYWSN